MFLENKDVQNGKGERYLKILREIDSKIINSKKGYRKIRNNGFRWDDFEDKIFENRMKKITSSQLLGAMDSSYVDGDSNAKVSLHEYHFEDIIQL